MPLPALDAAQVLAAMATGDSDLKFLLADTEVDDEVQAVLFHYGFNKMRLFANIESTVDKVRVIIRDQLGLDPDVDLRTRSRVAHVLAAWESSKEQVARDNEVRAEARSSRQTRTLPASEGQAMRRAVVAKFGKIPNEEIPGRFYMATKLEEVEENEPRPESLKDVASKEDGEQDILTADLNNLGAITVRKGVKDLRMPADSEELRIRHRLICNAWLFAAAKHHNRPWLAGLEPDDFSRFSDYVLGKKVWGMKAKDGQGNLIATPTWELVLSYEFELRKHAYDAVRDEGITLAVALTLAVKDTELRARYLITPMTFLASFPGKRAHDAPDQGEWPKKAKGKGEGKGGDDKPPKQKLHVRTPDGRNICFKFNNPEERCDGNCGFVHVCQLCLGANHPKHNCPSTGGTERGTGRGRGRGRGKNRRKNRGGGAGTGGTGGAAAGGPAVVE